jgi:hypothetical protein
MRRLFNEATKVIEDDVRWLHDAAERFEEVAHLLPKPKRASWILLTDMYDERAGIHARLAEKMRRVSGAS